MTPRRQPWEVYADIIEACPEVYSRLISKANIDNEMLRRTINLGLLKKIRGPCEDSDRKMVNWVHATEEGLKLLECVREIQKILLEVII